MHPSAQQQNISVQSEAAPERFLQRCRSLTLIKLLCHLTKAVQQHRGASMAVLSGEKAFLPLVAQRQAGIARILDILELANKERGPILPAGALLSIANEWNTVVNGWQHDQIMHNFQFHCHLIEALHRLIRDSIQQQLLPCLPQSGDSQNGLIDALFVQTPDITEHLAMLRGISTNVAVLRDCGEDSHVRISYLLKVVREKSQQLSQTLASLGAAAAPIAAVKLLEEQQKGLHKLLLRVQIAVLESPQITTDSSYLFNLSTEIIDAHWLAIEQGLLQIDLWLFQYGIN